MYIPRLVLLVCLVAVVYAECDVRGLLQAVGSSDFDLVRSFLKQKDCNIDSVDDFYMYTPLFVAVLAGHEEMVKMLVTEYKPNLGHLSDVTFPDHKGNPSGGEMAKAGTGMSPLHVAVTQPPGRENIIKILLDAGAPIDKQSVYHGTAMHYAFRHNRPVALRMLVERKANVTLFDAENQRPLQRGAQVGSVEAVREFLSIAATNPAYFKVVDQPDLLGNTALATACSTGQTEIVKLLLQAKRPGLKDSTRMVPMVDRNKVNSRGNTCLHVAAALDFEEIIDALFESELIGNRAISSGKYPDMNKKNADGKTPLDLATKKAAKASLKKFAHIQPDKTEL